MGYDTKPNLDNSKFEQRNVDVLDLSGSTNILNSITIESGSTFYIKTSGSTGDVLTKELNGLSLWKTPTIKISNNNLLTCMSNPTGLSSTGNVFVGVLVGDKTTIGGNNIVLGACAFRNNTCGEYNTAINSQSLGHNIIGCHNIAIGYRSMCLNTIGCNNIAIGHCAGFSNATGSSNIYIGKCAGFSELGSCKLHIGICSTESLICGDFSTKQLKICGSLSITGVDARSGETNLIYYNQSNGKLSYASANASNISISPISPFTGTTVQELSNEYANALNNVSVSVSNGLCKSGNYVVLGGALTGNTNVCLNTKTLQFCDGLTTFSANSSLINAIVDNGTCYTYTNIDGFGYYSEANNSVEYSQFNVLPLKAEMIAVDSFNNQTCFGLYANTDSCFNLFNNLVIKSNNTSTAKYAADYSANFTARSLVDAAYVTGKTSTSGIQTANNGLIKVGTNVVLGGTLTGNTNINLNSKSFSLSNGDFILSNLSGTTNRLVEATSTGLITADKEIILGKITNATVISLLVDENNWDVNGNYIGIDITGTYEGQYYRDANYFYFNYDDNDWTRMIRG